MTYTITLAAGTDWINANERSHWASKARRTKYWRNRAHLEARRLGIPRLNRAHITVTVHKTTARKYDANNLQLTAKALVDGIVDAGVLVDDDNAHLVGPDMRAGEKRDVRQLVVTIEALPTTEEKTA